MRFCLYVCSIDKRGCYYNGPSIMGSELINFFVEHKKIQPFVKFICLPLLSQLIHLLKSFLYLFYYYFIDTTLCSTLLQPFYLVLLKPSPCLVVNVFFNVCFDSPFRHILCTDYLRSYKRLLKMGMI